MRTSAEASSAGALAALVDELLERVDGLVPAAARRDLEDARERLTGQRVNVVVLGEFKRGKSTLVNALVDDDVVPTGALPLTAAVTVLRHGPEPRLLVDFADGRASAVAPERIAEFATEAGNPENRLGVELLTVELPAPLLAGGLQLVDTPGMGSAHLHNTDAALAFLGRVDAALFTLAADQPLSAAEEQLVGEVAPRVPRTFVALNKVDHLSDEERDEAVAFVRERLRGLLAGEPELFPVSARHRHGLESLRHRLASLAAYEREDVLEGSVRALAASFAAEAVQAVRFEARAVELPQLELEERLAAFRERTARLASARDEAAQLLHEAARRLVAEAIDEPLLSLADAEGDELRAGLRSVVRAAGPVTPRVLAAQLDRWIDEAIRSRFQRLVETYERRLADELDELQDRYADRVDEVLRNLDAAAAETFGTRAGRRAPQVSLRRRSRFAFKLHDLERELLDQLASLAAVSAPGGLGRRLVRRQAEERLALLLDRHAGRLRSDLAARVGASIAEYERELSDVVGEAIASVEAAVARAAHEQRGGRERVAARLGELDRVERSVAAIASRLAGASPR